MRFELTGESVAVNLAVAYAPTEANRNTQMKEEFWEKKMGHMVEQIPTKECLVVLLVDANARTGKRMEGCGDGRVLGAYGRDELNSNGKRQLVFASANELALTNTCFSTRKGGISHTFNGISSRNDQNRNTTSCPAKHTDLACIMVRSTPILRLQPRRIQTLYRMGDGPPQPSFLTQPIRTNEKQNSGFRPAEISIRRRLHAASRGADPIKVSPPSLETEQCL